MKKLDCLNRIIAKYKFKKPNVSGKNTAKPNPETQNPEPALQSPSSKEKQNTAKQKPAQDEKQSNPYTQQAKETKQPEKLQQESKQPNESQQPNGSQQEAGKSSKRRKKTSKQKHEEQKQQNPTANTTANQGDINIEKLTSTNLVLEEELAKLKEQISTLKDEAKKANIQANKIQEELTAEKIKNQQKDNKINSLEAITKEKDQIISQLKEQQAIQQNEITKTKNKLKEQELLTQELQSHLDQKLDQKSEREQQETNSRQEIQSLYKKLTASEQQRDAALNEIKKVTAENAELQNRIKIFNAAPTPTLISKQTQTKPIEITYPQDIPPKDQATKFLGPEIKNIEEFDDLPPFLQQIIKNSLDHFEKIKDAKAQIAMKGSSVYQGLFLEKNISQEKFNKVQKSRKIRPPQDIDFSIKITQLLNKESIELDEEEKSKLIILMRDIFGDEEIANKINDKDINQESTFFSNKYKFTSNDNKRNLAIYKSITSDGKANFSIRYQDKDKKLDIIINNQEIDTSKTDWTNSLENKIIFTPNSLNKGEILLEKFSPCETKKEDTAITINLNSKKCLLNLCFINALGLIKDDVFQESLKAENLHSTHEFPKTLFSKNPLSTLLRELGFGNTERESYITEKLIRNNVKKFISDHKKLENREIESKFLGNLEKISEKQSTEFKLGNIAIKPIFQDAMKSLNIELKNTIETDPLRQERQNQSRKGGKDEGQDQIKEGQENLKLLFQRNSPKEIQNQLDGYQNPQEAQNQSREGGQDQIKEGQENLKCPFPVNSSKEERNQSTEYQKPQEESENEIKKEGDKDEGQDQIKEGQENLKLLFQRSFTQTQWDRSQDPQEEIKPKNSLSPYNLTNQALNKSECQTTKQTKY